jgi:hypothetical protein
VILLIRYCFWFILLFLIVFGSFLSPLVYFSVSLFVLLLIFLLFFFSISHFILFVVLFVFLLMLCSCAARPADVLSVRLHRLLGMVSTTKQNKPSCVVLFVMFVFCRDPLTGWGSVKWNLLSQYFVSLP